MSRVAKLKVLLVEDDLDIAAGIGDFLAAHGVTVDFAANATEARARVGADVFDVLVLDVNLPGMDGISLCAELKQTRGLRTPAIFLTARGELADKLRGFAAGGVDYMVKPFAPAELLARIRALTAHAAAAGGSRVCIDGYELDLSGAELRHGEQRLSLHASALTILRALMEAYPRSVSRQALCAQLWGDEMPESDPLRAHIYALRQALHTSFGVAPISTVRGIGYRFGVEK